MTTSKTSGAEAGAKRAGAKKSGAKPSGAKPSGAKPAGGKTVRIEQVGSASRRHHSQRETLIGFAAEPHRPRLRADRYAVGPRHDRQSPAIVRVVDAK